METAITTAVSGGTAGSLSALITTPVDVIKTRIMLSAADESSEAAAQRKTESARERGESRANFASKKGVTKKSGLTVAREVMRENGVKGLFRGAALRTTWTGLGSGLYLGVYESGRVWLGDQHESREENL